jgi:hypothetical protein
MVFFGELRLGWWIDMVDGRFVIWHIPTLRFGKQSRDMSYQARIVTIHTRLTILLLPFVAIRGAKRSGLDMTYLLVQCLCADMPYQIAIRRAKCSGLDMTYHLTRNGWARICHITPPNNNKKPKKPCIFASL